MQPNNPNPYYPPRDPSQPQVTPQMPVSGQPPNLSGLSNNGPAWGWIITVIMLVLVLLGVAGFGFWAFAQMQDYKNNSDQKAAAAVEVAKKKTTEENNVRFAEELKNPLKTYIGPASYGAVNIQYPKTWSAYVSANAGGEAVLDGYFHPDIVPALTESQGDGARPAIALRVQILNSSYDQVVESRAQGSEEGAIVAVPYALPKMPNQIGTKFTGKLSEELNGTEIVIPLRDKTLVITTDTEQYLPDFNTYILPNLSFEP